MYDPEKCRQERQRILAEIEAIRTSEQKLEAESLRAQRAAYEALPSSRKTEIEELEVFNDFATHVPDAHIDSGSGINATRPQPDIRCTVASILLYFELGEITDQRVARSRTDAIKHMEPRGCAYSQEDPFEYIIKKKCTRSYQTNGSPVELLLYYRKQSPPLPCDLEKMLKNAATDLLTLVSNGPFQRVWIYNFWNKHLLWLS